MPEDPHPISDPGEIEPGQGEPGGAGGEPDADVGPVPFVRHFVLREVEPRVFTLGGD